MIHVQDFLLLSSRLLCGWYCRDAGVGIQCILQRLVNASQVQGSSVRHQRARRAAATGHFRHHRRLDLEHPLGHDVRPTRR